MNTKAKLRAWWHVRQALDGRLAGQSAASILTETGWARSVGGSNPYVSLFTRGGLTRSDIELAANEKDIHELPSARGCTYILPASDFALGLTAGESFRESEMRVAYKVGVTDAEIEELCLAVVSALSDKVLSPDEIRRATGDASRSLGEEGKKKGMTTTLPLALSKLQAKGAIRRVPVDDRLDQQRYLYTVWNPNPREAFSMQPDQVATELAARFFKWAGPATVAEFQWFSALGVQAAKRAVEPLNLVPLADHPTRMLLPDDVEQFECFEIPGEPQFALISSIDGVSLLRRDLSSLLDEADIDRQVFSSKALARLGGLADLPSNGILDRGRLVGLWEFDPGEQRIIWTAFIPRSKPLNDKVEAMESFVRDQLGDARSFSLDSPKSRQPVLEALRQASLTE